MGGSRRPRVGIKDVALEAGVSVGTVSHVLNRPERVSEARRLAVLAAIEHLGYVPNHAARTLKEGTSRLVGYLYPDPLSAYFSNLALGVLREAESRGLDVLSAPSFGDASRASRYLALFAQQRARGVVVAPGGTDLTNELNTLTRGTPIILANASDPAGRLCSVSTDNVAGGALAVEHLIRRGARRIVMLGPDIPASRERWQGAQRAAHALGGASVEFLTIPAVALATGRDATNMLLDRPADQRPDAIFATADTIAYGVLNAIFRRPSIRVPHDLAVIGYDNLPFSDNAIVPLTSVHQHEAEIGRQAVALLEDEVTNPAHQHQSVVLQPELVVRASTGG